MTGPKRTCPSTVVSRVNTSSQSGAGNGDAEADLSASTSGSGSPTSGFCLSCFSLGGLFSCWTRMIVSLVRDVAEYGTATHTALCGQVTQVGNSSRLGFNRPLLPTDTWTKLQTISFLYGLLRNTVHVDGAVDWDWDRDWTGSIRYVRC